MTFCPTASDLAADLPWERPWTVAEPVCFEGVGMHTGELSALRLLPAPAGTGYRFRRMDLPGRPEVLAVAEHVVDTRMSTNLAVGDVRIQTVEHLLAALWGLGVSDVNIELEGPEVPIMDGSAAPFVAAIETAGVEAIAGVRPVLALQAAGIGEGDRLVSTLPGHEPRISVAVDYHHPHAGAGLYQAVLTPALFAREIAPARTFGFMHEVAQMRAAGLAKGGSADNAIVIDADGPSSPLRFPDELVRHKALDLVGDMALVGARWLGQVVAVKAGHGLHTRLAAQLRPLPRPIQEVTP